MSVGRAVDEFGYFRGSLLQLIEIVNQYFGSTALVISPTVQLDRYREVGKAECLVELSHIGLVDAFDSELTSSNIL